MSEATQFDLNNGDLLDLDTSAPSNADAHTNGSSTETQDTQNGFLNCEVGEKTPPQLAEPRN
jgi:hypothetical protein